MNGFLPGGNSGPESLPIRRGGGEGISEKGREKDWVRESWGKIIFLLFWFLCIGVVVVEAKVIGSFCVPILNISVGYLRNTFID